MMLTRLRLRNVKSYRDAVVEFKPGINGILGENGHGKSTILEAIGYALFDFLPYAEREFLRQGAKSGSVELDFVGEDEITYTLKRKVGGSDLRLITPIGEITGKKDVQDWIVDNLFPHINDPKELRSIFENTLGVPQGSFTTAFAQTPSVRKNVFDGVLGVDEYKKAFNNLRTVMEVVKEEISGLEKQQIMLQTETRGYEALKREQSELQHLIAELSGEIERLRRRLDEVGRRREQLEAEQKKLHQLEVELQALEASRGNTEEQLNRINREVEQAEAAERVVSELAGENREYEESEEKLKELYGRREQRNRDHQRILALENSLTLLLERESRRVELEEELSRLRVEREQLIPSAQRQETLQREIEVLQRDLKEPLQHLIFERETLQEAQRQIDELNSKIKALQGEISHLLPLSEKQKHLIAEIDERSHSIAVVRSEIEGLKAKSAQVGTSNLCPIMQGVECRSVTDFNTYFTQEIRRKQKTLDTLEKEFSTLQGELEALNDPMRQISQRETLIATLQEELAGLQQTPEKLLENTAKLQRLSERFSQYISPLKGEQSDIEQVEKILKELRGELETLSDARTELASREALIDTKQQELQELSQIASQIHNLQEELAHQRAHFSKTYSGLDESIAVMEGKIEKLKKSHETYLQHKPLAEKKPQLIEEQRAISKKLEELLENIEKHRIEYQELQTRFSEAEYQQVTRELETLGRSLSAKQSLHQEKTKQHRAKQEELKQMEDKLEELKQLEETLAEERNLQSYLTFIRDLLNNSAQLIVLELINQTARDATNIYCEIMNDYSLELRWSEDYNIILLEAGEERSFQQLSGGEQMSAALAVRLALMRLISKSDIVFLDEPTANMDVQRRENLSHQIRNIHGFKQLFIISHDDTFNEQCDHVIYVEKINGESRITTL
jgi:exonuclease SbcC